MRATTAPLAVLLLILASAQPGLSKVHEVLWDVPADGLQLPSISTIKCGDVIRFRCPAHATHGIYKLESTNYNGTCPTSYDLPMVGEVLSAPTQACDYSLTVTDGPDFFITSHVPGACQRNLKVYVHAVCLRDENTYASSLLGGLAVLPSLPKLLPSGLGLGGLSSSALGGGPSSPSMPGGADKSLGGLMGGSSAVLGTSRGGMSRMTAPGLESSDAGTLEAAQQSGAANVRPALAQLAAAAAAALVVVLAL